MPATLIKIRNAKVHPTYVRIRSLSRLVRESSKHLDLSDRGIFDDDIYTIGQLLKRNRKIRTIDLSNNHITDKGVQNLVALLKQYTKIKHIDISGNAQVKESKFIVRGCIARNDQGKPFRSSHLLNPALFSVQPTAVKNADQSPDQRAKKQLCTIL